MKSREEMLQAYDDKYSLFGMLFAFGNRLQTAGDAFYEEITCKQFFFLICLYLFGEEAPTLSELAEVMGSSRQNVKQLALKLEQNGFIRLWMDEQDRRKLRIKGTLKLEELSQKYNGKQQEFLQKFFAGVAEKDITVTYRVMCKMEQNLVKIKEQNE